ncbi:FHA domain-containing protein [Streptosporangiaceae bacterium NEAU-GS5]|nr:FHA domain-containing protein [Streptosporangiaceae bacterium NEAU-GS5]
MADIACPFCGEAAPEGGLLCPSCGGPLLASMTRLGAVPPQASADTCPKCGAEIPDPANKVCVECLEPFDPPRTSGAAAGGAADTVTGTRRDVPRTLVAEFTTGEVVVKPGESALLGRDPAIGMAARVLHTFDNVSRRHATLGVEPNGAAWVRDEDSTNGTFVNGSPAGAQVKTVLHDGDRLRLAADVEASIRLMEHDDA